MSLYNDNKVRSENDRNNEANMSDIKSAIGNILCKQHHEPPTTNAAAAEYLAHLSLQFMHDLSTEAWKLSELTNSHIIKSSHVKFLARNHPEMIDKIDSLIEFEDDIKEDKKQRKNQQY